MPPSTPHATIARPGPDEYAPYYERYIRLVAPDDALEALIAQAEPTARCLGAVDEAGALRRYAPGKWTVKQVVGHVVDSERVFAYRALRIARGDATPLPGFDENRFAEHGDFDARPLADLVLEYRAVRAASIALFASLSEVTLGRRGVANDTPVSARAIAWMIAGHELHHRRVLIERYGLPEA